MTYIELLRDLQSDMSQVDFAELLSIAQSYLSMIYAEKRKPGPKMIKALLQHFPERRGEIIGVFFVESITTKHNGSSQNIGGENG